MGRGLHGGGGGGGFGGGGGGFGGGGFGGGGPGGGFGGPGPGGGFGGPGWGWGGYGGWGGPGFGSPQGLRAFCWLVLICVTLSMADWIWWAANSCDGSTVNCVDGVCEDDFDNSAACSGYLWLFSVIL